MWELDHKEGWKPKNWCFWTVVLQKILGSPCTARRSNQTILKEINPEELLEGLIAQALILWPPDANSPIIGKDPDVGEDWRQEEKGMTEDELFGRCHWLNGHEFRWPLGDGEGQGSLVCCSRWGCKKSDMSYQLNNTTTIKMCVQPLGRP